MKNTIFFVLCVALSTTALANEPKNDLESMHLKGKVKSVIVTKYSVVDKFGTLLKSQNSEESFQFNKSGNEEKYSHSNNGHLVAFHGSSFDQNGNKIETLYFNYAKQFEKKEAMVWDNNKLVEKTTYDNLGDIADKLIIKRDYQGNDTADYQYDSKGKMIAHYQHIYENGNLSYSISVDDKGSTFLFEELAYNGQGKIAKKTETIGRYTKVTSFDEAGNDIEETFMNGQHSVEYDFRYKYDDQNNIIELKVLREAGNKEVEITNISDDDFANDGYKDMAYRNRSESYTCKYEYDETGNIIRKVKYKLKFGEQSPEELTEYKIVYYP